jgi:hypothetical protein
MIVQDLLNALNKFPPTAKITLAYEEEAADYDEEGNDIDTIELSPIEEIVDEIVLLADEIEVIRLGG